MENLDHLVDLITDRLMEKIPVDMVVVAIIDKVDYHSDEEY